MVYHHHTCCDPKFKEYIKHKHRNCLKTKPAKHISGRKLNAFYGIDLKDDISYKVGYNIYISLQG